MVKQHVKTHSWPHDQPWLSTWSTMVNSSTTTCSNFIINHDETIVNHVQTGWTKIKHTDKHDWTITKKHGQIIVKIIIKSWLKHMVTPWSNHMVISWENHGQTMFKPHGSTMLKPWLNYMVKPWLHVIEYGFLWLTMVYHDFILLTMVFIQVHLKMLFVCISYYINYIQFI